jgi:hypothetical protein
MTVGESGTDSMTGDASGDSASGSDSNTASGGTATTDPSGGSSDSAGTVFDVGAGGEVFCQNREAGVYCSDNRAIVCGDSGNVVSDDGCVPGVCQEGVGCVDCLDGQYTCDGPRVMACDTTQDPAVWQEMEVCDPSANEACTLCDYANDPNCDDPPLGACRTTPLLGSATPTGSYYQYALFAADSNPYMGGGDVDSWIAGTLPGDDNRIVVYNNAGTFDIYTVDLLDSDGDGVLEPNQHPDNPDETGPIEERVLTHLESVAAPAGLSATINELYMPSPDRLFNGGPTLDEFVIAGGSNTLVSTPPTWMGSQRFSFIGRDEINGRWYAGNENGGTIGPTGGRRVYQHSPETDTWGIAFDYPDLAGSHADGMEVVVDERTGTPYVYISDMTSDFIGQYRWDLNKGWVQENLFQYTGTGDLVEGMGFGAFNHFWATGGQSGSLYEVGGGDLQEYVEPPG